MGTVGSLAREAWGHQTQLEEALEAMEVVGEETTITTSMENNFALILVSK